MPFDGCVWWQVCWPGGSWQTNGSESWGWWHQGGHRATLSHRQQRHKIIISSWFVKIDCCTSCLKWIESLFFLVSGCYAAHWPLKHKCHYKWVIKSQFCKMTNATEHLSLRTCLLISVDITEILKMRQTRRLGVSRNIRSNRAKLGKRMKSAPDVQNHFTNSKSEPDCSRLLGGIRRWQPATAADTNTVIMFKYSLSSAG